MNRIVVERRVNDEGLLQILLSLGLEQAGRDVRVTVEPVGPNGTITPEEWRAGILATAGGWQGDLAFPKESDLEERDPLS